MMRKDENGENSKAGAAASWYCDDDVVISGIAGRFPESDNMYHLRDNLFNKVDLITDDDRRWKIVDPKKRLYTGKINNIGKFDSFFFAVPVKHAHAMDPMGRMMLEHAYEAIVDAGMNVRQLRGTRTGVFVGSGISESEKVNYYDNQGLIGFNFLTIYVSRRQSSGFGIIGCSKSMLANRISYWLGITGPSYSIDSACSSSLTAMESAYGAIRNGQCDAALVAGSNLCLDPNLAFHYVQLGTLSTQGRCKSFDADGDGFVRGDAVCVVYLQKAKHAKRIYATCIYGKSNCDGFKEQGITFPSSEMQGNLLKDFYKECGIPPSIVSYVEAHGTGTKIGDPEEVNAIESVFCPGRSSPLKIGSVKSNLGHTEAASGVVSVAKVVIAMETGLIPPNLHYKRPRDGVKALEEGRIKVVTEVTPWEGGYAGISGFGIGGANTHILLKSNPKEKVNGGAPSDDLPRLVIISGRTVEAVDCILKDVERRSVDVEYIGLLQNIHSENIPGHVYRGYTIVGGSATKENPLREIQHFPGTKRPIWFVFSGMGSQWPGMGAKLLRLPVFAAAIKKCDVVLKPRGVDIYDILTNKSKSTFDNIRNSFVGIAAIQIGLVDLLTYVGIVSDNIIGHSVGELGCAYADGCFTAEQTILAAYFRGLAIIETKTIDGLMAAVGLGYGEVKDLCPPDIEVACHNGPQSSSISGPAESIIAFITKLQASNIFAKKVPTSDIAFHSRYIAKAGPKLLAYLQEVIPDPKARSSKWLSTSVCRSDWGKFAAQFSSAEYHTNNLLSPVLFEETSSLIPNDAVTIEIAPHCLLQAILRRTLKPGVTNIGLTQRYHKDNFEVFLQAIGKTFNVGLVPQISKLFPEVQFPVKRGTPMISPLIKWEHSDNWFVASDELQEKLASGERTVTVTGSDEDYNYMAGHVIDGRNVFPATGYLVFVWETFGMMRGELYTEVSVVLEDVKFLRATNIPKEGSIKLTIQIQSGSGRFEVIEHGVAVATGVIRNTAKPAQERMDLPAPNDDNGVQEMSSKDFYKMLRICGYQHGGLFRGVKSATINGSKSTIAWSNNWVTFLDNMLQTNMLAIGNAKELLTTTEIQKLTIDTKSHLNSIRTGANQEEEVNVRVYKEYNAIVSDGVEVRGLKRSAISRRKTDAKPVLEYYNFVAHRDGSETSLNEFVRMSCSIVLENNLTVKLKTIEAIDDGMAPSLEDLASPYILETVGDLPIIEADVNIAASSNPFEDGKLPESVTFIELKKLTAEAAGFLVCGRELFTKSKTETLCQLLLALKDGGFLLTREIGNAADICAASMRRNLDIVLEKRMNNESMLLFRKRCKVPIHTAIINVASNNLEWIPQLQSAMKADLEKDAGTSTIILVSDKHFENGLMGLINCLRKEPGGNVFRGYLIQDENAPKFSKEDPLYATQLQLDLGVNVLRENGVWGTYRHRLLPEVTEKPMSHVLANQLVHGDLNSLRWLEGPLNPTKDKRNRVSVVYASINFRDVMLATGKLGLIAKNDCFQEYNVLGSEYSGVDYSGRRIMGLVEARSFTNFLNHDENLCWQVPEAWSLEDAATVPSVYATCYYALYLKGKMKKCDKVLIHTGAGSVGQAAITLALQEGCEVFTTVGTPDKRKFIRKRFPQISENHVGNSRDISFEQMVLRETKGRGVDIVLNSLTEEKLQASVRCLATGGRFLEIGKFDLEANSTLSMNVFLREMSFISVMVDSFLHATPEKKSMLQKLVQAGLDRGHVKPLTRTIFPKEELEAAFRYVAAGKNIGKVIVRIHCKNQALDSAVKALPRFYCLPDRSYLILGGLGGFGLELTDWLILRGARNIVLTSRVGIKNGYQLRHTELWKSYGIKVVIVSGKDASKREDCVHILNTTSKLAPIDGIFNLSVVLNDRLMENQTVTSFEESLRCKAWSTKQLDEVSRKLCPLLRKFVVFSSFTCGRGHAGQPNYGMANSVMERICEKRVAEGLPGLAVQWGAIGDVGIATEMLENREFVLGGTRLQGISSCLVVLDKFLKQNASIVSCIVVAEKRTGGSESVNIVDTVLNIMNLKDLNSVSMNTSLSELGLDSMMALEIKQALEREFEIFLTSQDIRGLNFVKLIKMSKDDVEHKKCDENRTIKSEIDRFIHLFGDNEWTQEVCLKLPTKEDAGMDDVFLIPGIEGCGNIFRNLAGKIRSPASCLQLLSNDDSNASITNMAQEFLPYVLERYKNRSNFVIVGYSYGSMVAIELVRELEAEGLTGRLVLIDGSAEFMKSWLQRFAPTNTEEEFHNNILLLIIELFAPSSRPELVDALEKCKTWSEKLNAYMAVTPTKGARVTPEKQRSFCIAVLQRFLAAQKYDHSGVPPLRSSVILLKPTFPILKSLSLDYGLSMVTRGKLDIYTVDGDHMTILDNVKTAMAINGDLLGDAATVNTQQHGSTIQ